MRVFICLPEQGFLPSAQNAIDKAFADKGFDITWADDPDDLLSLMRVYDYDAVLFGINGQAKMPGAALRAIADLEPKGPHIYLFDAPRADTLFNLVSSGAGFIMPCADNDTVKLLPDFVLNTVRAQRRQSNEITLGPLRIDRLAHAVYVNDVQVHFTGQEFTLLDYLASEHGTAKTKEQMYLKLYDYEAEVDGKILDVFVCKVRDKLNTALPGLGDCIQTVWGVGYAYTQDPDAGKRYAKRFGPLAVDYISQQVLWNDQPLDLTITEFMVMKTLAYNFPEPTAINDLIVEASRFGRDADEKTIQRAMGMIENAVAEHNDRVGLLFLTGPDGRNITLNLLDIDSKAARKVKYDIVTLGPIRINQTTRDVSFKANRLPLTARELDILGVMADAFPAPLTAADIAAKLELDSEMAVRPALYSLRDKLAEANGGNAVIDARRGIGYQLSLRGASVQKQIESATDIIRCGPWQLDPTQKYISFAARPGDDSSLQQLSLSAREYRGLAALINAYPEAISRDALLAAVGRADDGESFNSSVFLAQLKMKLNNQQQGAGAALRKVDGGNGFRLDIDIDQIPQSALDRCVISECGPWAINQTAHMVTFDGDPVDLNETEYRLMCAFVSAYPNFLPKEELAASLHDGNASSLNQTLTLLRKKLREHHNITEDVIRNVRGQGYILNPDRREVSDGLVDAMNMTVLGEIEINHSLRQVGYDGGFANLNGVESFALKALCDAKAPLTATDISEMSRAQGDGWGAQAVYFALTLSLRAKMEELGIDYEDVIHPRRRNGFCLTERYADIIQHAQIITHGRWTLNETMETVSYQPVNRTAPPVVIDLKPAEFQLCRLLFENPHLPLTPETMSRLAEEDGFPLVAATITQAHHSLARKITDAGIEDALVTSLKGLGYVLTSKASSIAPVFLQKPRETTPRDDVVIEYGPLVLNTLTQAVTYDGMAIDTVNGPVFDMLAHLAKAGDAGMTPHDLADIICGSSDPVALARLDRGIGSLKYQLSRSFPKLGDILIDWSQKEGRLSVYKGDPHDRFMELFVAPAPKSLGVQKSTPRVQQVLRSFEELAALMPVEA